MSIVRWIKNKFKREKNPFLAGETFEWGGKNFPTNEKVEKGLPKCNDFYSYPETKSFYSNSKYEMESCKWKEKTYCVTSGIWIPAKPTGGVSGEF